MSLIVIDFTGDLVATVLRRLAAHAVPAQRVLLWDAADAALLPGFNPLSGNGTVHRRVGAFIGALKREANSWGVQLDETLRCFGIALAESGYSPLEYDPLFTNSAFRSSVKRGVHDPYTRDFLVRFDRLSPDQQRMQHAACMNKLAPFVAEPRLRRIFGGGDPKALRDAIDRKGAIILISLAGDVLGETAGVLGEMLVHCIWQTILGRARLREVDRPQTRLIVDEFQQCGQELFGTMIAEGRRFGLSLTLAHQSQIQLSGSLRALLRNNAAIRLIMAPGPVDANELASELSPRSHAQAYASLMTLSTGQGYLVRRGSEAERIQTPREDQISVTEEAVSVFRSEVLSQSARPIGVIDKKLSEQAMTIAAMAAPAAHKQEVIHAKRPWKRS